MLKNVLVGGIAAIAEVDEAKFTQPVIEYLLRIGLKNVLQDSHASITEKTEADAEKRLALKTAQAMKKLDSLYKGEVSAVRVNATDPVEREMRNMALERIREALAKVGKKLKDFDKEVLEKQVVAVMTSNDAAFRKAAEAKLAIKPEVSGEEADMLSGLGL